MRIAAKIDKNQPEIVSGLEDVGASVKSLAAVGGGVHDLLVGFRGVNYLLEVKNPDTEVKAFREGNNAAALTPDQKKFHFFWQGQGAIVWSLDDALQAIGAVNEDMV